MENELEAIGAQKTPDGYVLDLKLENFAKSTAWITESLRVNKDDSKYFSYLIEFDYINSFGEHEIKINKRFTDFKELNQCIQDFKEFAKRYL